MNTIFVSLVIFTTFIQYGICDSAQQMMDIKDKCLASETYADRGALEKHIAQLSVDETNNDIIVFYSCFSKAMNVLTADGNINDAEIVRHVAEYLSSVLTGADAQTKAEQLAPKGFAQCKDKLNKEHFHKSSVAFRNCITNFINANNN